MSIDVTLTAARKERFSQSLTDNVREIAVQAGLYNPIWCPCQFVSGRDGIACLTPQASELIDALESGLFCLRINAEIFRNQNGTHDFITLREFVEKYLAACKKWPDALVVVT